MFSKSNVLKIISLNFLSQDEESDRVHYIMEVCSVQEKLDTFELIYGPNLIEHWYNIDMKDMFNTLIEILNKVIYSLKNTHKNTYVVFNSCILPGGNDKCPNSLAEAQC